MTTFETYVEWINKLYKNNPELKEVEVVTSSEDGWSFHSIIHSPSKGKLIDEEFKSCDNNNEVNVICLN